MKVTVDFADYPDLYKKIKEIGVLSYRDVSSTLLYIASQYRESTLVGYRVLVVRPQEHKIHQIKFVRQLTGMGLKESKDAVEALPEKPIVINPCTTKAGVDNIMDAFVVFNNEMDNGFGRRFTSDMIKVEEIYG